MPIIDMPLERLKTYMGVNPCPNDMDEFWDTSIAEMKALDANVELRLAEFQVPFAECFDLRFTGVDGSRVYSKYVRPANN
ncbi:MAG: acetylxylan esterase, partial [Lentisphaerae bacterium]|nr:acetylxylan esterase [Lentisphaerota bacterium]